MAMQERISVASLALLVACGTTPPASVSDTSSTSTSDEATSTTSSTGPTGDATSTSTTGSASSSSGDPLDGIPPGFLNPRDGGSSWECSIWLEDCPPGEKCMPYANDGGGAWNAQGCFPIAPDPAGPGEPCTVTNSGVSGIDDCEPHAMCWGVDHETLEGTCVAMCIGNESFPTCAEADHVCTISSGGELALCLPTCDPLLQDCDVGEGCYPTGDAYTCVPDASGKGGGSFESCKFTNACDPGFVCSSAPVCGAQLGCCVPFCSVSEPDCPAGTTCVPGLEPGTAPIGAEDVGVCAGEA